MSATRWLWLIASVCALALLPCAVLLGWLMMGRLATTPPAQVALAQPVQPAKPATLVQPAERATFQEIEDRLNAGGWKVGRIKSPRYHESMWFGEGTPADLSHELGILGESFGLL